MIVFEGLSAILRRAVCLSVVGLFLFLPASASALDPQSFEEISSGVVKIKATSCKSGGWSVGSGFLVGTSVVVTAHHVVAGCRAAQVLVQNREWIPVAASTTWIDAKTKLDVSTLKLSRPVKETWLFAFRPGQAPIGTFIAVLGYPLGQGESGWLSAGLFPGEATGDNVIGYDFSSRWGGWRSTMCAAYPNGGIDDCP